MVAAIVSGEPRLRLIANRADDCGAEVLGPLADNESDAARRGMDQDRLAALHRMGAADEVPGGHALQHHCRGLLVGDAIGHRDETVGRHYALIGISAEGPAGIGDAIARFQTTDTGSDFLDDPGALGAEATRQRHLVEPAALIGVDVIEPDRGMAQPNLTLAWLADLNRLPRQNLWASGFLETNCMRHDCPHSFLERKER